MASYEYEPYVQDPPSPINPNMNYEDIVIPDPEDSNYARVYHNCPNSSYIREDTPYERIPNIIHIPSPTENILEKQRLREDMWSKKM